MKELGTVYYLNFQCIRARSYKIFNNSYTNFLIEQTSVGTLIFIRSKILITFMIDVSSDFSVLDLL